MWETAFDVTDPTFDCNVNRTNGDPSTQLYTINHFLDEEVSVIATSIAPDKDALNTTNAASGDGSLGKQASECGVQHGRSPNFMLVDVSLLGFAHHKVYALTSGVYPVLRIRWRISV